MSESSAWLEMIEDYRGDHPQAFVVVLMMFLRHLDSLPPDEAKFIAAELHADLAAGWRRWTSGEAREFGEAFRIERPKNWNQQAHRDLQAKGLATFDAVWELVQSGVATDEAFQRVAKRMHKSASWVRERYYEVKGPAK